MARVAPIGHRGCAVLMKQLTQRLCDGRLEVLDVPIPQLGEPRVLVDTRATLVSALLLTVELWLQIYLDRTRRFGAIAAAPACS